MRVLLISNPVSGSAEEGRLAEIVSVLRRLGEVHRLEPSSHRRFPDDVTSAAQSAEVVVTAGGDGTVNQTINALADRSADVVFGLLPTGTGNDLARTLGLPLDPVEAARSIVGGSEWVIDVATASSPGVERLFVNACIGGFPVEVDEAVDPKLKKRLGPVAFVVGGVKAAGELERATVRLNGIQVEDCLAVGVGNGRSCGGGIEVWPEADPGDGLLDGCALPASNAVEAARLAAKVKLGSHADIDAVKFERGRSIRIEAEPEVEFNVDGELIGLSTPATFEIARRIRFLVPHD